MQKQGSRLLSRASDGAFRTRHRRSSKASYVIVVGGRAVKIVEDMYYTLLDIGTKDAPNEFPSAETANYVAHLLRLQTWEVKEVELTVRGNILW